MLLFVYNANECTLAAGAFYEVHVSMSKKINSRLRERENWEVACWGRGLSNVANHTATKQVWANEGVDVEMSISVVCCPLVVVYFEEPTP